MEAVFDDSEGDTEVKTVSYNVDACIGDTKFRFAQYLRFSPASYAHYVDDAYEHNLLYHRWTGNRCQPCLSVGLKVIIGRVCESRQPRPRSVLRLCHRLSALAGLVQAFAS